MNAQIENFFSEIENLIKFQFQENVQDTSEVKKKFREGKRLIDELEEDNEELYKLFKSKYHITRASYLKAVGEIDDAIKQQKSAKKFEGIDTYKNESILFTKGKLNLNQSEESEEKSLLKDVEEQLKNIQSILGDKILGSIIQTFKQLDKVPITFKEYEEIVNYANLLNKTTDALICEVLINLEVPQDTDTNEVSKEQLEYQIKTLVEKNKNKHVFIDSLNRLKVLALEITYLRRIAFIQNVINSSNKKEVLYSDILFTEEEINKRSRKLASYFHPDKTNEPNNPNYLHDKHKNLGDEIFKDTQKFKDELLSELRVASNNEGLKFHEKKANELWKITIDYRNAAKEKWDKLKVLKKDEIKEFSSEELNNLSVENGILAYQEYRAACKIVDKEKQLQKQVKLRGNMALCLYVSNKYLEAQLYALSAIQLQLKYNGDVTKEDLIEAKNIFRKVKNENTPNETNETKPENNSLDLVKMGNQEISFFERKKIHCSVKDEMEKISTKLLLKPDRSLVRYQASQDEILCAKKRAVKYKTAGWVTAAAGTVGGVVSVAAGIYGTATLIGGIIFAPAAVFALGLGIFGSCSLWRESSSLLEEPEIRENLNKIMRDAVNSYDKGNYQAFFEQLSQKYDKNGTRLFKIEERDDSIVPKDIIDKLLIHGFRSDGIAYLLNLLGEVLSSGRIEVKGKTGKIEKTTDELKEMAKNVFAGVLNRKLKEEAEKFDARINHLRSNKFFRKSFYKVIDFVLFKEYSDVGKEHINDAREMPFQSRLKEMCNIARINLSIFDILSGNEQAINRAIETIGEIRDSINSEHQFVGMAESRLEALEDLLWIVHGDELPRKYSDELPLITFSVDTTNYTHTDYLCYLKEKIQQTTSKQEKIKIYYEIAVCYEQLAEKEDKINRLTSLKYWYHAQKSYENIREIDFDDLNATLGFAKCLLKLSKYTQVIRLRYTNQNLASSSEYFHYCSIAYCKQNNYEMANETILLALDLDSKNKSASNQWNILKQLEKNTITSRNKRYKKNIKFERIKSRKNNPIYSILSIDGGGIRGVLPALWLSEIESRTHRPISHLFSMIAGTSTGGFIAAGLSAPDWSISEEDYCNYSDFKPKFSASELLKFYQQDQIKEIFSNKRWNYFMSFFNTSSLDFNHYFRDHFRETRLSQALTELVIPATNNINNSTHLFTSYDARKDLSKDITFFKALMATTAAPTFFPPYNDYLDGGVHLNNPAMAAYNEAIRYKVSSENVSVLSLGTGAYIPDPLNPDKYWSQLFWPKDNHNAQECSTDRQMYDILGNRYQRWQVWFEEPIKFNDTNSISYLLEIGNQYIEELDASDENPMNKLVESFYDI
ncbi:hypothetical protein RclHR1_02350003 [Rhizophagus clarus]|uniref:Patatin n=1 Tax=Rhizophagus clarus TaxID=94130 RepID=A0A2Z6R9D6_9GLOM|nr:hypothetical protein RclHR1_02350003 [Rhizophagus clarus]GES76005.1 patatin [Rhizophagus clarus]